MVGKKRFGAPMTKKMLDSRKERLFGHGLKDLPENQLGQTSIDKIVNYYLIERENGIQVRHENDRES